MTLGNVSNLHISGGTDGYVLKTNGAGVLAWTAGSTTPGGSNTYVQFNNSGGFAGAAGLTFNQTSNLLTATNIAGNGSALTSLTGANVTGTVANATYATTAGTATSATTAGTVTTADQPNITSLGTLTSLSASNIIASGGAVASLSISASSNANAGILGLAAPGLLALGASANLFQIYTNNTASNTNALFARFHVNGVNKFSVDLAGNVTAGYYLGNGSQLTGVTSATAATVTSAAQPNITSTGTLTGLNVSSAVNATSFTSNVATGTAPFTVTSTTTVANLNVAQANLANTANAVAGANVSGQVANALVAGTVYTAAQPNITSTGTLTGLTVSNATGVVNFTTTANVTLGAVGNLHISGGTSGYVLSTDGASTLSWVAQSGGSGSPGGSNTYVQFNDASSFGGNASLTFNKTTGTLSTANLTVTGTSSPANLVTVKYNEGVIAGGSTGAATITPNAAAGTIYNYTLTGNITLSSLTNAVAGTGMTIILTQDATGNRTLTSTMKFLGGVKTLSTAASAIDIMSVFYDGTTYYATLGKGFA